MQALGNRGLRLSTYCFGFGALLTVIGRAAAPGDAERFFQSYYVAFCFYLSLSLGALFFVLLHHLANAKWSVVVRRVAETLAANLALMALLLIPVIVSAGGLPASVHAAHAGELASGKAAFLSRNFMLIRLAIYFTIWIGLALTFWSRSVKQDENASAALSARSHWWSGVGMVLFGFSIAFGGVDLLMALDPHWHSTIFGVYFFSGSTLGFLALLPLAVMALQVAGRLRHCVTPEHFHDMGKLLFAFVFFWTYIAFSQYMLIWYGNLPEETAWYALRASPTAGTWNVVSLALLFGHWMIPFVALLSREMKRRRVTLAFWCVWLLIAHYFDLYWIVWPQWSAESVPFGFSDIACVLGMGGIYLGGALALSARRAVLPINDPHLGESLAFENV
jgi:hypothetical protein